MCYSPRAGPPPSVPRRLRLVVSPMPPRLDADGQKQIDDAWNQALTPIDKYDNQTLLDLLVITQAYQLGVDSLTFRSEKSFVGGKVVMEIAFDRGEAGRRPIHRNCSGQKRQSVAD